jgi:hypothetical protein
VGGGSTTIWAAEVAGVSSSQPVDHVNVTVPNFVNSGSLSIVASCTSQLLFCTASGAGVSTLSPPFVVIQRLFGSDVMGAANASGTGTQVCQVTETGASPNVFNMMMIALRASSCDTGLVIDALPPLVNVTTTLTGAFQIPFGMTGNHCTLSIDCDVHSFACLLHSDCGRWAEPNHCWQLDGEWRAQRGRLHYGGADGATGFVTVFGHCASDHPAPNIKCGADNYRFWHHNWCW